MGQGCSGARLARGLARAIERHGATIYEQTRVVDFVPGKRPLLRTDHGDVRARVIVLAGEAYLSQLEKTKRDIIPMTSHMVVTEPLSAGQWEAIGWDRSELVGGFGTTGGYLNHTVDGRIAFGAYRAQYPFKSRITDALDLQESIFAHARRATLAWFPMLRGVKFTHAWGGVFGAPRDHMPTMAYDPKLGVATGQGYTGDGVSTANLSGRVLADLITETDSDLTKLPMTKHRPRAWEREPVRWLGVKAVMQSRRRTNRVVECTGRHPTRPTVADRLWDW